jgi:[protein-PII] uridylyltransferase
MDTAAIAQSFWDDSAGAADLTQRARAYVRRTRSFLLEKHRVGAGGREIAGLHSDLIDGLIRNLVAEATVSYARRNPGWGQRCAVVAHGGYGRGELSPHSDVDLLFLYNWKTSGFVEWVAEKTLHALWDAGVQVGHAARSVAQSMRLAGKDTKVRTSLLDARLLCGDASIWKEFADAAEEWLVRRNGRRFIQETLAEAENRRRRFGGSVYLLEPDVKEGEGGLRDIHGALWIGRVKCGIRVLDDFVAHGLLRPEDLAELKAGEDFLWRVRNELHFSSGKHRDQLRFEEQERVAQALGFTEERKLRNVEVFMRTYYRHAAQVSRLTSLALHRLSEPSVGVEAKRELVGREISPGIRLARKQLSLAESATLDGGPEALLGLFAAAQRRKVELSHETRELVRARLGSIDDTARRSAALGAAFMAILKGERVYETLVDMHRCGVLGALIPEFERLLCMVLHDHYHIYTVDQHSLRLVKELELFKSGGARDVSPLITQLARETEKNDILYMGALFHDIGKGYGGGHSELGSQMARQIARRLRLNADDSAQVEFLVRHHLLMSTVALRRDLDDDKTIKDFARSVRTVTNLKMLFLLTCADIKSVAPGIWSDWKASLLEQLYLATLPVLEVWEKGEALTENRPARVRRIRERLRRRAGAEFGPTKARALTSALPAPYLLTTPEEDMPRHLKLVDKAAAGGFVTELRHFPERGFSEWAICTGDRSGLFALITGVLAASGFDVLSARATTCSNGIVLDVFRISHGDRADIAQARPRWDRVERRLAKALNGTLDVARLVEESGRPSLIRRPAPRVPTLIKVDNEASDGLTVVEVYTEDRIAVLFTIAETLHRLGVSIHFAKISTNVDQAADIFYVTDSQGKKIVDGRKLEAIEQGLYGSLVSRDERQSQSVS